ncbi:MAG: TolC family protein [Terracidiphilus sp.]
MPVNRAHNFVFRPANAALFTAAALAGAAIYAQAQSANPTSASNPFFGSVTMQPANGELLKLSLDDAIRRGLKNNLGIKEAEYGEKTLQGEKNEAIQEFLPTITLTADTGIYQHNLAALGFSSSVAGHFASLLPSGAKFSPITRDDLTEGQIHFEQTLFSGPVIAGYKAVGAAERVAYYTTESAIGQVVQNVATAYLQAIAAASEVDDATAREQQAEVLLNNANEAHQAGTVPRLDLLRAQVELQSEQQAVIAAQDNLEKDLILLKREIGITPGQKVDLTDRAPYSELALQTPAEVLAVAYKNRQNYQNLISQVAEDKAIHAAYRSQRWPTLKFNSYYAVSKVNGVGSHGNFAAIGTLSVPIFKEAGLRGDIDAAKAQLDSANAQLADLRTQIDEQVRDALLDVAAAQKLVDVARSNVALATRALSDETDRVNAGVDNNLPLVTAQATLASAQTNLVQSLYQYNVAKLGLARAAGVILTQYRAYLGR